MFGRQTLETSDEHGSVLLAALTILTILAVTITAIMIFGGWRRAQGVLYLEDVRVRSLAESGIHYATAELASDPLHGIREQRVVFDSANQISYTIRPLGAYLQIQSTGIGRRLTRTLTAIVGMRPPDIFDHVLSPIDPSLPLVLSGSTNIHGNVYVNSGGITEGEINGRGFRGNRLVEGTIELLDPLVLPRFDDAVLREFLDSLEKMKTGIPEDDFSLIYRDIADLTILPHNGILGARTRAGIEFDAPDSTAIESPQYFFAEHSIRVLGKSHLRNLVLSSKTVIVAHQAYLENCVIVADQVQLTDGSTFSGQIIGTDTVRIESNASLRPPTLVLLRGRKIEEQIVGEVDISSLGSLQTIAVNGSRSAVGGKDSLAISTCRLRVGENATLYGLIWWEGVVELDGTFKGAAAVNLFSHCVPPTTYMNWLVDADLGYLDIASMSAFPMIFEGATRPRLSRMIGNN